MIKSLGVSSIAFERSRCRWLKEEGGAGGSFDWLVRVRFNIVKLYAAEMEGAFVF